MKKSAEKSKEKILPGLKGDRKWDHTEFAGMGKSIELVVWACVLCLPALTSCTAVRRQLPLFADTGWIWRLFFCSL